MAETTTTLSRDAGPGQTVGQRLSTAIQHRMPAFAAVATKFLTPDRLIKLAQVAVAKNPDLAHCSTLSVLDCLMTCARLGLEPNEPGGVWLVPFKGTCTAIIDYRGMIDVCRRSGSLTAVHADMRHANDLWEYRIDTSGPTLVTLRHAPADGPRGDVLGAFFVVKLSNGECQAVYLSKDQIDAFRARSKADKAGFSPWKTDYAAMAMKTAVRRGVNLLPRTPETQALREELTKEDKADALDVQAIVGPAADDGGDTVARMLAEIGAVDKSRSDRIAGAFDSLGYGVAKRLQVLTKWADDTAGLAAHLEALASDGQAPEPVKDPEVEPEPERDPEPKPKPKGKRIRKKTATVKPAEPEPAAKPVVRPEFKGGSF